MLFRIVLLILCFFRAPVIAAPLHLQGHKASLIHSLSEFPQILPTPSHRNSGENPTAAGLSYIFADDVTQADAATGANFARLDAPLLECNCLQFPKCRSPT